MQGEVASRRPDREASRAPKDRRRVGRAPSHGLSPRRPDRRIRVLAPACLDTRHVGAASLGVRAGWPAVCTTSQT